MQKKIGDPRDNMANRERAAAKLQTLLLARKTKKLEHPVASKVFFLSLSICSKLGYLKQEQQWEHKSDDFKNIEVEIIFYISNITFFIFMFKFDYNF